MVVIDELEQEQLRCLYGEKAIWEYRYKKHSYMQSCEMLIKRETPKQITTASQGLDVDRSKLQTKTKMCITCYSKAAKLATCKLKQQHVQL